MTELDRVALEGEVVDHDPMLEKCAGLWEQGKSRTLWGQLEMAIGAAEYMRYHGKGWVEVFSDRVKEAEKSKVYDYAVVGRRFGKFIEEGDHDFSARVESGIPTMSLLRECAKEKTPEKAMKALDAAVEDHASANALKAQNKKKKQKQAEDEYGSPENITVPKCPSCGAPSSAWERPPVEVSK